MLAIILTVILISLVSAVVVFTMRSNKQSHRYDIREQFAYRKDEFWAFISKLPKTKTAVINLSGEKTSDILEKMLYLFETQKDDLNCVDNSELSKVILQDNNLYLTSQPFNIARNKFFARGIASYGNVGLKSANARTDFILANDNIDLDFGTLLTCSHLEGRKVSFGQPDRMKFSSDKEYGGVVYSKVPDWEDVKTINSESNISQNMVARGDLRIEKNTAINHTIKVYGDLYIEDSVILKAPVIVEGNIYISGRVEISDRVLSYGKIYVQGDLFAGSEEKKVQIICKEALINNPFELHGSIQSLKPYGIKIVKQ